MRNAEVNIQVAHVAERFFGTAGTTAERGRGGDPRDDEGQECMTETLNVAFVQVRYNAVYVSVFDSVDVL